MRYLSRAIGVELLKLRRTLALWASWLIPLAVLAMTTAINLSRARGTKFVLDEPNGWDSLMLDLTLVLWCFVVLPLFVTLEAALLAGIEHRENTWKHLFALPIPRWTIYVAKILVGFGLVCITSVVLAAGSALQGWMIVTLRPDLGLSTPIPWALIFWRSFSFVPPVLLMLAVETWVAVSWRSFTVPITLGVSCTAVTIMLLRTIKNNVSTPYGPYLAAYFPWSLPYVVIAPGATPNLRETAFLVGVLGGLLVSVLGCLEIVRRDVA
jgi:hypothetical protein